MQVTTCEVIEVSTQVYAECYKNVVFLSIQWKGVLIMKWVVGGILVIVIVPVTMTIVAAVALHKVSMYQRGLLMK